jgi:hypothetical protein
MANYAVLQNTVVENIVSAEADTAEASWVLVPEGVLVQIGWLYENGSFTAPQATAEWNETEAKTLLEESDWTQLQDVGLTQDCVSSFATYRAALRAIAVNPTEGDKSWPDKPSVVYM